MSVSLFAVRMAPCFEKLLSTVELGRHSRDYRQIQNSSPGSSQTAYFISTESWQNYYTGAVCQFVAYIPMTTNNALQKVLTTSNRSFQKQRGHRKMKNNFYLKSIMLSEFQININHER